MYDERLPGGQPFGGMKIYISSFTVNTKSSLCTIRQTDLYE